MSLTAMLDESLPVWLRQRRGVRWVWHEPKGWLIGWTWMPAGAKTTWRDMGISWVLLHLGPGFLELWWHVDDPHLTEPGAAA